MSSNNESRLKAAGLRMALKLIPPELLQAAPQHLEGFLKERLSQVEPMQGEAGTCFLIAPQGDGSLAVLTVTLDEQNTIVREVQRTNLSEIFNAIIDNFKEL